MRAIPGPQKIKMSNDPYYSKCCYPLPHVCGGKLDWHHNLILAGKQSNIYETILPLCKGIHDMARDKVIKEHLDLIMLERMSRTQRLSLSKAIDYNQRYEYLKLIHRWKNPLKKEFKINCLPREASNPVIKCKISGVE